MLRWFVKTCPRVYGDRLSFNAFSGMLIASTGAELSSSQLSNPTTSSSNDSSEEDEKSDKDGEILLRNEIKCEEGAQLMRSLNIKQFREELEEVAESRQQLSHAEFVQLAKKSGAAMTDEESARLCRALAETGNVFQFRGTVFLRTDEISQLMIAALPKAESKYQKRLEQLETELRPLEDVNLQTERKAEKFSRKFIVSGFCVLLLQLGVFIRLTYWELSWDYMEPISYFVSLGNAILIYGYFLLVKVNPDFASLQASIKDYYKKRSSKTFDKARYDKLKQELQRCRRYVPRHLP